MNAVNVETGLTEWFGSGADTSVSLVDALYASAALPVFYPPARVNEHGYVDGGYRAHPSRSTAPRSSGRPGSSAWTSAPASRATRTGCSRRRCSRSTCACSRSCRGGIARTWSRTGRSRPSSSCARGSGDTRRSTSRTSSTSSRRRARRCSGRGRAGTWKGGERWRVAGAGGSRRRPFAHSPAASARTIPSIASRTVATGRLEPLTRIASAISRPRASTR